MSNRQLTNIEIVSSFWKKVWNKKEFAALEDLISLDYSVTSLSNPDKVIIGREAIKQNVLNAWKQYSKFKLKLQKIYCDGNSVVSVIKLSGIDNSNNRHMIMNEIVIHTIKESRITHALSISSHWVLAKKGIVI